VENEQIAMGDVFDGYNLAKMIQIQEEEKKRKVE
jgi:hypothetical protein